MIGGALTTAGNLVFAGEGNGSFNAYNAVTGQKVWSFQAGAGVNAAPMAFEVDGKLHIAVAAGGNFQLNFKRGDAVLVFALVYVLGNLLVDLAYLAIDPRTRRGPA